MARRKYVKENNLVKAINTDSLELQKPLVNEYYDINVHNSNMDKIDKGYKQNKNDISNINNELSKTENTSYTTENGVKEFECKNGYVDNVVIEGETLVNISCIASKNVGEDAIRTRFDNTGDNYNPRYSDGTFTLINYTDKVISFPTMKNSNVSWSTQYDIQPNSKIAVQIPNDASLVGVDFWGINGWTVSSDTIINDSFFAVLEGDHTDKPITYFEGLKSVGQGDKIEVLTQNSDETKQDKKQILTTLRSLPNGVKDTIEKRGNKYVKVQRCGEIVLNGSEDWFKVGDIVQANTVQFGFKKGNDVAYKGDSEVFFNCDKIPPTEERNWQEDREFIFINPNDYIISISKTRLSTQDVAGFKTWLKSNPITVVYELATPIIEELPNFNPQTFSDKTTLLLNSGVVQGEASFEVTNSLGSELEVLKEIASDLSNCYDLKYFISPLNGFYKPDWAEQSYLYKKDNMVFAHILLTRDTATPQGTMILKVPSSYAPKNDTRFSYIGITNSVVSSGLCDIFPDGSMYINTATNGKTEFRISFAWSVM